MEGGAEYRVFGHRGAQGQRGSERALGVVTMGLWQSKDGHHRIADKLLDGAGVVSYDAPGVGVVALHEGTHVLWVEAVAKRRGPGDIGEEDGDELAFLGHP